MGKNNTNNITNKNGNQLVRDENGRVVSGVLNPNGRPKKGMTLTDVTREILEEELPDGRSRKEALMRKVATLAYEGNETMIKLIWNYIDGLPVQRNEITGKDGKDLPTPILKINTDVLRNNSDKEDKPIIKTT